MQNDITTLENTLAISYKLLMYTFIVWPRNPTFKYLPQKNEHLRSCKTCIQILVASLFIMPTSRNNTDSFIGWIDKQIIIHSIQYNPPQQWKGSNYWYTHQHRWIFKEPYLRSFLLYTCVYMTFWKRKKKTIVMIQISAFYQRLGLEDSTTWVDRTV